MDFNFHQHDKILILWVAFSNLAGPHRILLFSHNLLFRGTIITWLQGCFSTKQSLEEIPSVILWESDTLQWAQQKSNSKYLKMDRGNMTWLRDPSIQKAMSAQLCPSHTHHREARTPRFLCYFQRWNVNDPDDLETNLNPSVWPTFISQN